MSTTPASAVAERFLEALSRRDFEGLAAAFAEGGRLRALEQTAYTEIDGEGIRSMNLVCSGARAVV